MFVKAAHCFIFCEFHNWGLSFHYNISLFSPSDIMAPYFLMGFFWFCGSERHVFL